MPSEYKISPAAARVNAKMTQEAAAEAIGVSKKTIVNWESGETIPDAICLAKMAEVYHYPIDGIIFLRKEST